MVLIKLRLNVPNLDLAYRFEVSLSMCRVSLKRGWKY